MSSINTSSLIDQVKTTLGSVPVLNKLIPIKGDKASSDDATTVPAKDGNTVDDNTAGDVATPSASQLFGFSRDGLRGRIMNRLQRRVTELQDTVMALNPLAEQKSAPPKSTSTSNASTPKSNAQTPSTKASPKAASPAASSSGRADAPTNSTPKAESA